MTNLKMSFGTNKKKDLKMWIQLLRLLMPFAIDTIRSYVKSSDSKQDDKILSIAQETASYLSVKDNNTLSLNTADILLSAKMK